MLLLALVVVIVCINFIKTFTSPVFKLELINETDLKCKKIRPVLAKSILGIM